jgi:SET domain-containing protein
MASPSRARASSFSNDSPLVVVKRSRIQGRGVFARSAIRKDARIIEYLGERLKPAVAEARYDDEAMKRHHTFLFDAGRVVIDATKTGNESRFINHSCKPNCYIEIKRSRVFIHAKRAILEGEELFYDYWYSTDASYTDEDRRRLYPCRCGAPKCRGTLAAPQKKKRA